METESDQLIALLQEMAMIVSIYEVTRDSCIDELDKVVIARKSKYLDGLEGRSDNADELRRRVAEKIRDEQMVMVNEPDAVRVSVIRRMTWTMLRIATRSALRIASMRRISVFADCVMELLASICGAGSKDMPVGVDHLSTEMGRFESRALAFDEDDIISPAGTMRLEAGPQSQNEYQRILLMERVDVNVGGEEADEMWAAFGTHMRVDLKQLCDLLDDGGIMTDGTQTETRMKEIVASLVAVIDIASRIGDEHSRTQMRALTTVMTNAYEALGLLVTSRKPVYRTYYRLSEKKTLWGRVRIGAIDFVDAGGNAIESHQLTARHLLFKYYGLAVKGQQFVTPKDHRRFGRVCVGYIAHVDSKCDPIAGTPRVAPKAVVFLIYARRMWIKDELFGDSLSSMCYPTGMGVHHMAFIVVKRYWRLKHTDQDLEVDEKLPDVVYQGKLRTFHFNANDQMDPVVRARDGITEIRVPDDEWMCVEDFVAQDKVKGPSPASIEEINKRLREADEVTRASLKEYRDDLTTAYFADALP